MSRQILPLLAAAQFWMTAFAGTTMTDPGASRRIPAGSVLWRFAPDPIQVASGARDAGPKPACEGAGSSPGCAEVRFVPDPVSRSAFVGNVLEVPVEAWRGAVVVIEAQVRAQVPLDSLPGPSHGICLALKYSTASGKLFQTRLVRWVPSSEWARVAETLEVGSDARKGSVQIGIQGARHDILFRNAVVRALRVPPDRSDAKPRGKEIPATKTRYRGLTGAGTAIGAFDTLAAWNVNLMRWHLAGGIHNDAFPVEYDKWLDAKLKELDRGMIEARRTGVKIVVCLMDPPGGRSGRTLRMVLDKNWSDRFLAAWETIARRYKGEPALRGYDLINEPVQEEGVAGVPDWWEIQLEAARRIRAIDPEPTLFLEVDGFDNPPQFRWLGAPPLENVVYETHMYVPHSYTHQGVYHDRGVPGGDPVQAYPGVIDGNWTDKDSLRRYLQPVRDFQLAYGVPIFLGEFSAVRWAPGASRYLQDCIDLFEEYGWDWCYHGFRGASVWDPEIADTMPNRHERRRALETTDRLKLLKTFWRRNQRTTRRDSSTIARDSDADPR